MNKSHLPALLVVVAAALATVILVLRRRKTAATDDSAPVLPVSGRVSQGYSASHRGVDIAVPAGTEVLAPWDGQVTKVWWDDKYGGGRSMLVKHPNGYTTGYAHLEGYHAGTGDRVQQGQQIALSGNSGSHTTGPHLHFTLRNLAGVKIDPTSIFSF